MIGILRYTAGNLTSIAGALSRLGIPWRIVETEAEITGVDGLIFPGAGAAKAAMSDLQERGLLDAIRNFYKPFLGICLGMQLLFDYSEEGPTECLGIVPGCVKLLPDEVMRPHIGWNRLDNGYWAYFAHSYYCLPADPRQITGFARHGIEFCAGVRRRNFFGVQWHPEKSGETGNRFFRSFGRLCK